eukprot:1589373-Amphidinium_carterae.2
MEPKSFPQRSHTLVLLCERKRNHLNRDNICFSLDPTAGSGGLIDKDSANVLHLCEKCGNGLTLRPFTRILFRKEVIFVEIMS